MSTEQPTFSTRVKPTTLILSIVVLALLCFFTLFDNQKQPIVRKWADASVTWTFKDDYRGQHFTFAKGDDKKTGKWTLNNEQLQLTYDVDSSYIKKQLAEQTAAIQTVTDSTQQDSLAIAPPPPPKPKEIPPQTATFTIEQASNNKLTLKNAQTNYELSDAQTALGKFSNNSLFRGLLGIFGLLLIAFLFSTNRRAIDWNLVVMGISLQVLFALAVLKVSFIRAIFQFISSFFVKVLEFTAAGSNFMFGNLLDASNGWGYIFAVQVLPTIIFFSALSALLYYLGILQKIVYAFAWVMSKTMRLSGAESLAAAANIFIGQTESPLVVKPYLEKMTKSEIMCLMTGGMATIAGGVFAAYVGYLGGTDPEQQLLFATHLLSASIMSAPAAIVAAKMLFPETNHENVNQTLDIPKQKIGSNLLDAVANGTTDGLKLAVNVGAMLIAFIALIAMFNSIFADFIGAYTGLNEYVDVWSGGKYDKLTLEFLLGILFAPLAWLIGVPTVDILSVGQLLGVKTIVNEFVAYAAMGDLKNAGALVEQKSLIIATYALCGFANFSSIGIQIGGIGSIAPGQKQTLSALGILALIGGTIACFLTGVIAGMLVG